MILLEISIFLFVKHHMNLDPINKEEPHTNI